MPTQVRLRRFVESVMSFPMGIEQTSTAVLAILDDDESVQIVSARSEVVEQARVSLSQAEDWTTALQSCHLHSPG